MLQDRVGFVAQNGGSIVFKTWGYTDRLMGGSLGDLQLGREELRLLSMKMQSPSWWVTDGKVSSVFWQLQRAKRLCSLVQNGFCFISESLARLSVSSGWLGCDLPLSIIIIGVGAVLYSECCSSFFKPGRFSFRSYVGSEAHAPAWRGQSLLLIDIIGVPDLAIMRTHLSREMRVSWFQNFARFSLKIAAEGWT